MRKLLVIIILFITSLSAFSQVSYTKVVRVANATTTFSEPLSEGNILIDLNTDKTYLILKAIAGTNSIAVLTAGVDYKEIADANPVATDSTFVWVQADTVFVGANIAAVDSAHGVTINENLTIEADGTIRMDSSATVWRDELHPLIGERLDSKSSSVIINYDDFTIDFQEGATVADGIVMNIQINHDWDGETPVQPHLHWFQSQGARPNWLIAYRWHQNGQAKVTDWTQQAVVSSAFNYVSGTILQISTFGSISPPATPTGVSSILQLKLMRDSDNDSGLFGVDPYTGDAQALSLDIHIKVNTVGSRTEYQK